MSHSGSFPKLWISAGDRNRATYCGGRSMNAGFTKPAQKHCRSFARTCLRMRLNGLVAQPGTRFRARAYTSAAFAISPPWDEITRRPDNCTARSGRSRLDPNPIDGHQEVHLVAQAGRDICHLEQLLSDLVRRGQVRGHMVRKGSRIAEIPGLVNENMSSSFERWDGILDTLAQGIREGVCIRADRVVEELDLGPEVGARCIDRDDPEAPTPLRHDVVTSILGSLRSDDGRFRADLSGDRLASDLLALQDQHDAERFVVCEAATDHFAVSRFENLECERRLRKQDGMQREQREPHAGPAIPREGISLRHFG